MISKAAKFYSPETSLQALSIYRWDIGNVACPKTYDARDVAIPMDTVVQGEVTDSHGICLSTHMDSDVIL